MFSYHHHIGDFIRDTARLTDAQCMAYLRLIWMYYDQEGPIPDDAKRLAFKIGASESDVALILEHFFTLDANAMRAHKRCDDEISAYRNRSEGAKKAASARWNNTDGMRTHSERNANVQLSTANREPITENRKPKRKACAFPDDFTLSEASIAYAKERGLDVDREFEKFRNHHQAKGSTMKDWNAAWRTWCGNAVEYGRAKAASQQHQTKHAREGVQSDGSYIDANGKQWTNRDCWWFSTEQVAERQKKSA